MTTQLVPNSMSLPPPLHLELHDGDRLVGWVGDSGLGFRGFGSEDEAVSAAWMAHRTLWRRLARRDGQRPVPIDVEPLSLAWRDGREAILASTRPIGTLLRPAPDSRSGPDSFGFEIPMPLTDELSVRSAAHLIYRTLRRSGIRWQLWRRDQGGIDAAARAGGRGAGRDDGHGVVRPAELADPDRRAFTVEGSTMSYRDGPGRYGFEATARPGRPRAARRRWPATPSAMGLLARVILGVLAVVAGGALLLSAPRVVTRPIAVVVGIGLLGSALLAILSRRPPGGRGSFSRPRRPARGRQHGGRTTRPSLRGAGWAAAGWLSTVVLAVAILGARQANLEPGSLGAALGVAGLAGLLMVGHSHVAADRLRPRRLPARAGRPTRADEVDAASVDSFPASDPPSWTAFRPGAPAERERAS